jgi:hypothetical protein
MIEIQVVGVNDAKYWQGQELGSVLGQITTQNQNLQDVTALTPSPQTLDNYNKITKLNCTKRCQLSWLYLGIRS